MTTDEILARAGELSAFFERWGARLAGLEPSVIPCSNCLVCTTSADDNCSPGEHPHCDGCEHCFFMHVPAMVRMTATDDDPTDTTV